MKSEVNLEKVSYEKVMRMNEKMMIRRGGVLVLVIGLGKLKKSEWEWDWEEVEKKNGMIIREKKKWSWWNGKIYYCVVSEEEKSYAKKWLNNVVESMYGTIEEVERKEDPIEEDESIPQAKAVLKRMQHGDVTDQMPLQDPTLTEAKVSNAYFTWQIVSVRCNQEGTHVVKSCTPKVCGTYIYSDGNEVLIDSTTGERYGIIQSELPPTPREAWILRDTQTVYFRELYPPLKSTTKALDINNGNGEYYIRNWQIRTEIKQ